MHGLRFDRWIIAIIFWVRLVPLLCLVMVVLGLSVNVLYVSRIKVINLLLLSCPTRIHHHPINPQSYIVIVLTLTQDQPLCGNRTVHSAWVSLHGVCI